MKVKRESPTRADLEGDLLAIDDSFGAMRDADSAARGRDDRSEHLDRMWRIGA